MARSGKSCPSRPVSDTINRDWWDGLQPVLTTTKCGCLWSCILDQNCTIIQHHPFLTKISQWNELVTPYWPGYCSSMVPWPPTWFTNDYGFSPSICPPWPVPPHLLAHGPAPEAALRAGAHGAACAATAGVSHGGVAGVVTAMVCHQWWMVDG